MNQSPFKFLSPYEAKDKHLFFGRDREIEELAELLLRSRFVVVYGPSGSGKTSLIRGGLAKKLQDTHWFPIYIRRKKDFLSSCTEELDKFYHPAKIPPSGINETNPNHSLLLQIKQVSRLYLRPVYLIFDQLEELFITGTDDEREQFLTFLKTIDESDIPCKIILSLREEYLAHLYQFEKQILTLLDFRLRVELMTNESIKDLIMDMFRAMPEVELNDEENDADFIIAQLYDTTRQIQLPYLQVYLDRLWNNAIIQTPDKLPVQIDKTIIQNVGRIEGVLEKFLEEQITDIEQQNPELQSREGYVLSLLSKFVTSEGTRQSQYIKDIDKDEDNGLKIKILNYLEKQRILKEENGFYELYHDSLAIVIFRSQSAEQKKASNLLRRIERVHEDFSQYGQKPDYFLDRLSVEEFKSNRNTTVFQVLFQDLPKNRQENLKAFVNKSRDYHEKKYQLRRIRILFTTAVLLLSTVAVWQWRESSLNSLILASAFLSEDAPDDAIAIAYDAYQRPMHSPEAQKALLTAFYNHDKQDDHPLNMGFSPPTEQHDTFLSKVFHSAIRSVSFSPSQNFFLTVNQSGDSLMIWKNDWRMQAVFPFKEGIKQASFLNEKNHFYVITKANAFFTFSIEGNQLKTHPIPPNSVNSFLIGEQLYSIIDTTAIHNSFSNRTYRSKNCIRGISPFMLDGHPHFVTVEADDTIRVLRQDLVITHKKPLKAVRNASLSTDGRWLLARTFDNVLEIWQYPFHNKAQLVFKKADVKKTYFKADNQFVTLGDSLQVYDLDSPAISKFNCNCGKETVNHPMPVQYSPKVKLTTLICNDTIFSIRNKNGLQLLDIPHNKPINNGWFLRENEGYFFKKKANYQIITLADNTIHFWSNQGNHICAITPNEPLTAIYMDPYERWIVGVSKNKTWIWPTWNEIENWLKKEEKGGFLQPAKRIAIKKKYKVDDFAWDVLLRPLTRPFL
ncbi:nSTAND1 domain-containing NTPase [Runella aurantiaca]|uniref:Novel STAND NTPase 1 domain-containing protein n=1 Tax=Runella aurantiaca TaxID=2282308 RepID=A0A369IA67_9BACT|nr:AAA family ATPase [Runella aurantiaca]RDB06651.1 hypothetical protein DVG78_07890 [Runella aurantiaca]